MKKLVLIHIALTFLALIIVGAIGFFSFQKIAKAADDYCPMWEECADEEYGYKSRFEDNDRKDDNDIYKVEKESRIDSINNRPRKNPYNFSNTSRNTDKTIGDTVLRGLEPR